MIDAMRKERDIFVKHDRGALDSLACGLPGKKAALMTLVTLAVDLEDGLVPLAEAWAQLPKSRRARTSLDDLCKTTVPDISISRIVGLATQAGISWGLSVGNIFAALNHEKVMAASVKRALKPDGIMDRKLLFEGSMFLSPVGGLMLNASARAEPESQAAAGAAVVTPGLPLFETETLERAKLVRDDGHDEN